MKYTPTVSMKLWFFNIIFFRWFGLSPWHLLTVVFATSTVGSNAKFSKLHPSELFNRVSCEVLQLFQKFFAQIMNLLCSRSVHKHKVLATQLHCINCCFALLAELEGLFSAHLQCMYAYTVQISGPLYWPAVQGHMCVCVGAGLGPYTPSPPPPYPPSNAWRILSNFELSCPFLAFPLPFPRSALHSSIPWLTSLFFVSRPVSFPSLFELSLLPVAR
jgi:hypothetical protein